MISFQEIKRNLEICEEKFDNVLHSDPKRSKLLKSGLFTNFFVSSLPSFEIQILQYK